MTRVSDDITCGLVMRTPTSIAQLLAATFDKVERIQNNLARVVDYEARFPLPELTARVNGPS